MAMSCKVQGQLLLNMINVHLRRDLPPFFFGFVRNRQAADMYTVFQQVMMKTFEFQEPLYAMKVDIYKLFDKIRFDHIFHALRRRGVPSSLACFFIRQQLQSGLKVQLPGPLTSKAVIRLQCSVPQGHMASPAIAVAVLTDLIEPLVLS